MSLLVPSLCICLVVSASSFGPEPAPAPDYCKNASARAEVGMYGDIGSIGLTGPRGKLGQYVDLPADQEVIRLFNQGLAHIFGFNWVEAARNFKTAAYMSPECALCQWGVALTYSPNINYYIENQTALNSAIVRAVELSSAQPGLTPKTKLLIAALATLVTDVPNHVDGPHTPQRAAFAKSMCDGAESINLDPDVNSFCAYALMNQSPWNYYEGSNAGSHFPLKDFLIPAKEMLLTTINQTIEKNGLPHPLAVHLLIHLVEPSTAPESYRWLAAGPTTMLYNGTKGAGEMVPAQGHLTHMPAHLFLRVGMYREGVLTSKVSVADNLKYYSKCLIPYGLGHDEKMLVANARLAGMFDEALKYAKMTESDNAFLERTPNGGMGSVDASGPGSPEVILTLAKAGRFGDILQVEPPVEPSGTYKVQVPYHEASYRYARAIAFWALSASTKGRWQATAGVHGGNAPNATLVELGDKEAELSRASAAKAIGDDGSNFTAIIPSELAAFRSWYVDQNYNAAVASFVDAVAANDANIYMEPPRWYYPTRHCLGTALLKASGSARNASRALEVFATDLTNFVENPWSLYGAASALDVLGKNTEAAAYKARGAKAWHGGEAWPFISPCPLLGGI